MARTQVLYGERIGREGRIRLGCSAVIFDAKRERVLLTQRSDNSQWCLPGGGVDPGESVAEACIREVWEETGLGVKVVRLMGVYSDPNRLVIYPDGSKVQIVALCFEAEITSGEPKLSSETTAWGYFSIQEMAALEMLGNHRDRVVDALREEVAAIIH